MSAVIDNLLLLFDRPYEPVFTPKGDDEKIIEVPQEYLDERYQKLNVVFSLVDRFGAAASVKIPVAPIPKPDFTLPLKLKRNANFSLFIPLHLEMASQVIDFLLGMQDMNDFWSAAVFLRAKLNPQLFNYAYSVALLHRAETQNTDLFLLSELFPEKFFDGDVLANAAEEVEITKNSEERIVIDIKRNFTATDLDVEHRLAYFREDIGVNLHHWHWHLVYPTGPRNIADKDRRGELFFYMHQQILARYNFERFCNHMPRVKRLTNFQAPLEEAYFPKLSSKQLSKNWVGRGSNMLMQDVNRPEEGLFFDIQDLERWRYRLYDAIDKGFVINEQGERVPLTEKDGIDILGNMVEASELSINRRYYGNIHNMMHMAIATIHDPDFRHLEYFSVMGDSATAMRDPIFYRLHMMVDDVFQTYKKTLPGYTIDELDFPPVRVGSVCVKGEVREDNQLFTFWTKSAVNLSRGLDFQQRGAIYVKFPHLQHESFVYNIEVTNNGDETRGTVRIFIAPKLDEQGQRMDFKDQRKLFVELDRFTVNLSPGTQVIQRDSEKSSVTIPFERTYRDLDSRRPRDTAQEEKFNFCGCGWPHNLLIAKGTKEGFPCELFVMVSDYEKDKVEQEMPDHICTDAMSYCGVRNKKYPDARAMGYPFDRNGRPDVITLDDFLRGNMFVTDVKIYHVGDEMNLVGL